MQINQSSEPEAAWHTEQNTRTLANRSTVLFITFFTSYSTDASSRNRHHCAMVIKKRQLQQPSSSFPFGILDISLTIASYLEASACACQAAKRPRGREERVKHPLTENIMLTEHNGTTVSNIFKFNSREEIYSS